MMMLMTVVAVLAQALDAAGSGVSSGSGASMGRRLGGGEESAREAPN